MNSLIVNREFVSLAKITEGWQKFVGCEQGYINYTKLLDEHKFYVPASLLCKYDWSACISFNFDHCRLEFINESSNHVMDLTTLIQCGDRVYLFNESTDFKVYQLYLANLACLTVGKYLGHAEVTAEFAQLQMQEIADKFVFRSPDYQHSYQYFVAEFTKLHNKEQLTAADVYEFMQEGLRKKEQSDKFYKDRERNERKITHELPEVEFLAFFCKVMQLILAEHNKPAPATPRYTFEGLRQGFKNVTSLVHVDYDLQFTSADEFKDEGDLLRRCFDLADKSSKETWQDLHTLIQNADVTKCFDLYDYLVEVSEVAELGGRNGGIIRGIDKEMYDLASGERYFRVTELTKFGEQIVWDAVRNLKLFVQRGKFYVPQHTTPTQLPMLAYHALENVAPLQHQLHFHFYADSLFLTKVADLQTVLSHYIYGLALYALTKQQGDAALLAQVQPHFFHNLENKFFFVDQATNRAYQAFISKYVQLMRQDTVTLDQVLNIASRVPHSQCATASTTHEQQEFAEMFSKCFFNSVQHILHTISSSSATKSLHEIYTTYLQTSFSCASRCLYVPRHYDEVIDGFFERFGELEDVERSSELSLRSTLEFLSYLAEKDLDIGTFLKLIDLQNQYLQADGDLEKAIPKAYKPFGSRFDEWDRLGEGDRDSDNYWYRPSDWSIYGDDEDEE